MKPAFTSRWSSGFRALLGGVLAIGMTSPGAKAQCQYEITQIRGPYCDPYTDSPAIATDLNDAGEVVGFYYPCGFGPATAFHWTEASGLTPLDFPAPTVRSWAFDINESGQIVGRVDFAADGLGNLAFLRDGDTFVNLGTFPGGNFSEARGINEQGVVTGFWGNFVNGPNHGFIWQDGVMTDLGPTINGVFSRAFDINDAGAVTGWRYIDEGADATAFVWQDGLVTDLGPIPGGFSSEGTIINSSGQVAGRGTVQEVPTWWHAFFWSDGRMLDLGTLPGYTRSSGRGANNAGQVVGACHDLPTAEVTAFIWQDGTMWDINALIPANSGIYVSSASAINNRGQIAASGNALGANFAVVLTPTGLRPGDVNGDCQIGVADLIILIDAWGQTNSPADINDDGVVNVLDLIILLLNFGS